jgi:hypothetical protein
MLAKPYGLLVSTHYECRAMLLLLLYSAALLLAIEQYPSGRNFRYCLLPPLCDNVVGVAAIGGCKWIVDVCDRRRLEITSCIVWRGPL